MGGIVARLVEYVNPHPYSVTLVGPDRKQLEIKKYAKVVLSDWFMNRYVPKFLRVIRIIGEDHALEPRVLNTNMAPTQAVPQVLGQKRDKNPRSRRVVTKKKPTKLPQKFGGVRSGRKTATIRRNRKIVGKALGQASALYTQAIQEVAVAISNEIGIGILSFNRLDSLRRLIGSIRKHTDLSRTTVFVSDESTNPAVKEWLIQQTDIVVILNQSRLGIAGNTNRLMNCLRRFRYKIILNDDVEVIRPGWDQFYVDAINDTNYHHFCYRQDGLYGAKSIESKTTIENTRTIKTVYDKPHGAVMAYDEIAFEKVGYFDEELQYYGMEHVDWSNRVGLAKLQPMGFHDIEHSNSYFIIHNEHSVVKDKGKFLRENRAKYEKYRNDNSRLYVKSSPRSVVPRISVVVPIRDLDRSNAIETTIQNIKAQRYPDIEIILVEQDSKQKYNYAVIKPINFIFVPNDRPDQDFNKSKAFNKAVMATTCNSVLLHDADIVVQCDYLKKIANILNNHEACHIGQRVLYLDPPSTSAMCDTKHLDLAYKCERAVGYFEGGSIAFRKAMYFKVGGFNESYEGYGVEDCDFFERLKGNTNFYDERMVDMFHLWHSRTGGWSNRHAINKNLALTIQREMTVPQYIHQLVERLKGSYPEAKKFYELRKTH